LFRLKESVHVNAPIERCFLLSTSIELVQRTIQMRPVSGKTTGLVVDGDRVVWRGVKFGIPAFHHTRITKYERPIFFQDTMEHGMFRSFQHDHHLHFIDGQTLMYDIVRFSLPLGWAGHTVAKRIVVPHVLKLMLARFEMLKRLAEGDEWEQYIVDSADLAVARSATMADGIQRA
jgi:ligand-binding SRPBCC domain-containing protein